MVNKNISELALHYLQRSWGLGFCGTLKLIKARVENVFTVWSQSLWWGWKARRKMSDDALLARTTGKWQSVDALLEHLASRPASSFLLPHESSQETNRFLCRYYPEHVSAVLAVADAACRNEFSLLGQVYKFSHEIDWHRDPVTGWQSPLLHISRMNESIWSPARPADIRLIWELNRHQYFISLGIAYWFTGDKRYVDAFNSQIQSWIEANPLQYGINWVSSMEIAIRLLAWIVAFQFFRGSPHFREKAGNAFLKSLWQQADFLSNHLQDTIKGDFPNNHIIGELVGQILVGAAFPEFSLAVTWRDSGLQLLAEQSIAQTYVDGVNKEQAMEYHRFVAEFLLLVVARGHQGVLSYVPALEHTLENMLDYVASSLTPDGTVPMWGDSDDGHAVSWAPNRSLWDFRPILSAGTALFGRADWKFIANRFDEEAFWILGRDGLHSWQWLDVSPPEKTSRAFPQAGLYIMRDAWSADTDVAFFRCGPFGLGGEGNCAHAHCDLLSLILWVRGRPLLVDSGTYTYHGSCRDYFRLTAAHNTVMVDGCEQATPIPYFKWQHVPEAKCINWTERFVIGWLPCSDQVEFIRELSHPGPGKWELVDRFSGHTGAHDLSWFFHFAAGLTLAWIDSSESVMVEENGRPYVMVFPPKGVSVEICDDWVSSSYGNKDRNQVLRGRWKGDISSASGVNFCWKFMNVTKNNEVIL
jgi:hypothetical protein